MSYMKGTLTIRLDEDLERELDRLTVETGRTRSDLARDALRRQLGVVRFELLRDKVLPLAEAQGLLTDEDVFSVIS
jgi:predicted transcriptional regulator